MSTTKIGDDNAQDGLIVNGAIKVRNAAGAEVTVIDGEGKLIESASIEIADGDAFLDTNGNEVLKFNINASAVNEVSIENSATGIKPIIKATGEADTGLTFENDQSEEILILDAVPTAVNEVTIRNAAAGAKPVFAATGEVDNGFEFHNDQAEEVLILQSAATSVNEITITSSASASAPSLAATGDDTDIQLALVPKGAADVIVTGGRGVVSSVTSGFSPFVVAAAQDAVTDTAACSVANYYTTLTTTAAAVPTLADGTIIGQVKKIQMIVRAVGDAVLTPANLNGGTTITFADVGDTAELLWDGIGWGPIALYNIVDGATAPVFA